MHGFVDFLMQVLLLLLLLLLYNSCVKSSEFFFSVLIVASICMLMKLLGIIYCTFPFPAPEDYQAVNTSYIVPIGSTELFVNFSIASDSITENPESLRVALSDPSIGATIIDTVATVNIIDEQGMMNKHKINAGTFLSLCLNFPYQNKPYIIFL